MTMKRFRAAVLGAIPSRRCKAAAEVLLARKAAEVAREEEAEEEDEALEEALEAEAEAQRLAAEEEAKAAALAIRAFVKELSRQYGPQLKGVDRLPDGALKDAMLEVREITFKSALKILRVAEKLEGV